MTTQTSHLTIVSILCAPSASCCDLLIVHRLHSLGRLARNATLQFQTQGQLGSALPPYASEKKVQSRESVAGILVSVTIIAMLPDMQKGPMKQRSRGAIANQYVARNKDRQLEASMCFGSRTSHPRTGYRTRTPKNFHTDPIIIIFLSGAALLTDHRTRSKLLAYLTPLPEGYLFGMLFLRSRQRLAREKFPKSYGALIYSF